MNWTAFLLILASAFVHAWWNLRGKRVSPSAAFFLIADSSVLLLLLPVILLTWRFWIALPASFWLLLTGTGIFEAAGYVGLAYAYQTGELTLVYPLVRALGVMGVVFCRLACGAEIGALAIVGMFIIAAGCIMLFVRHAAREPRSDNLRKALPFACLAATGCVGYTLIDAQLLSYYRAAPGLPTPEISAGLLLVPLLLASSVLWLTLFIAFRPLERAALRKLLSSNRSYAAHTGMLIWTSYGLILIAVSFASDVSYVAAFRQMSLPLNHLIGVVLLKEQNSNSKLVSLAALVAGLVMVKLG